MSRLPKIANPHRQAYPSDLSDAEWTILEPLLPESRGFGRPLEVDFREILNGIFYMQRTGCQWEMIPMTCLLTQRSIATSRNGNVRESGKRCTILASQAPLGSGTTREFNGAIADSQ